MLIEDSMRNKNFSILSQLIDYQKQADLQTLQHYLHLYPSTKKKYADCDPDEIDFNGNRIVKRNFVSGVLDNTVTSWSDAFETKQIASTGATLNTSYYFANGELVAKKDNSGAISYIHNDHLGSSSVLTNSVGALVEATNYGPWGEIKSGGTQSKFAYTGQEHDGETGLNYYNARYYSSDIRRFTQPDTYTSNIYNPQDLNVYSYVLNNPLRYTDPTGHVGEILAYNNSLNRYYNKPNATTYNNVLNTVSSIQKQFFPPQKDKETEKGGVQNFVKQSLNSNPVGKFFFGNDINTLDSSHSTFVQKGWAVFGIASSLVPGGRGAKIVEEGGRVVKSLNEIKAGEFQFSKYHPGRVDEYHGISIDGTSEGIFRKDVNGNRLYSHTVWKDGEIVYQRDQFENIVIDTHR
ncbi:hypothetical protein HZA75_04485 [Candidatus Roizmanbacteria bacterium]|nr:hypothetical protein [Candidatus Roizmanbacteria bacterium]